MAVFKTIRTVATDIITDYGVDRKRERAVVEVERAVDHRERYAVAEKRFMKVKQVNVEELRKALGLA